MKTETKALIIDDEAEICKLLSNILRKKAIDVHCAGSLSEARLRLKTYMPSVIFLDNHLPDGLGTEFIQYLKTDYPQAKIVMITGQDIEIEESENKPEVVIKPFTSEKIYSVIDDIH